MQKLKEHNKEWLESFLEAGVILLLLFLFFWPVKIDGISMEKSFYHGDRVVISRVLIWANAYEKGDVLVFPIETGNEHKKLIKRMIGDEGDEIVISKGCVSVNGQILKEDYAMGNTEGDVTITVPQGQIFVLGDNREHSLDSRQLGTISKEKISGKVILRLYPIKNITLY